MPALYYKQQQLLSHPLKQDVITPERFNELFVAARPSGFVLHQVKQKFSFTGARGSFQQVSYQYGGFTEEIMGHHLFVPKAIALFDIKDFSYPDKVYFVSLVNGFVEIIKSNLKSFKNWYEIADHCYPVYGKRELSRVSETLSKVRTYLADEISAGKPFDSIKMRDQANIIS